MSSLTADAVICGAGLAGISAAYHLAAGGVREILLVDQGAPLSLTSDKSTECYRNWWPRLGPAGAAPAWAGDAMVQLTNRSIDLMEELARSSGNVFHLNRRGYLYVTGNLARAAAMQREAQAIAALGAGPLRCHTGQPGEPDYRPAGAAGFEGQPTGADFISDPALLRAAFPYLAENVVAALHVRRAGWLDAQQLGMYLLEEARARGAKLLRARVTEVDCAGGHVRGVQLATSSGATSASAPLFVDAAGPLCASVARMVGIELPVLAELHAKVTFHDVRRAVPREAPLLIWHDPQRLAWSPEERDAWQDSPATHALTGELPGGAHLRPDGAGDSVLMLWPYHTPPVEPRFPLQFEPWCAEITLRGASALLPALHGYMQHLPKPVVDGGYYLKTAENRPLIGPLAPVDGAYVIAALSGFGVMTTCAAGELLAAHVLGGQLPGYAPAFCLERYLDPGYLSLLTGRGEAGQL